MTALTLLWLASGLAVGTVHGWLLWTNLDRRQWLGFWLRYALVAGLLVLAATHRGLLPAAAGWALSFFAQCAWRWRRQAR